MDFAFFQTGDTNSLRQPAALSFRECINSRNECTTKAFDIQVLVDVIARTFQPGFVFRATLSIAVVAGRSFIAVGDEGV